MTRTAFSAVTALCVTLGCALVIDSATASIDSTYRLLRFDGQHVKWGEAELGAGAKVKYAFVDAPRQFAGARNCGVLVPIERLAIRHGISQATLQAEAAAAFRVWEQAANITFVPIDEPDRADILIGAQGHPAGRAYANVEYQSAGNDGVSVIDRAQICLNPYHGWKVGFDGNVDVYDIRYTLVHEIGHAIGLDHAGPSGQVMSFRYTEQFSDLQPGDLRGVQKLYGVSTQSMTADSAAD